MSSRSTRRTWRRPLRGGTNFSMRSLNRINPTLSLFLDRAERQDRADLGPPPPPSFARPVPKSPEPLTSTSSTTVSSRSSSNTFTNGAPARAVTFQSMLRMSSPYWYSRTSAKLMPKPMKSGVVLARRTRRSPDRAWRSPPARTCLRDLSRDHGRLYGTSTLPRTRLTDVVRRHLPRPPPRR